MKSNDILSNDIKRRSCIPSMKSMGLIVLEKTSGNQSTNQRPAFGGKSAEHEDMQ